MKTEIHRLSISLKFNETDLNKYIWASRRNLVNTRKVVKFTEALWRLIFYSAFIVLGVFSLFFCPKTQIWVSNSSLHWLGWPLTSVPSIITFYYQVELGCYVHQLLWTEVSRSDAFEMILHHIITILLIFLSHLANFSRIGASILLVHDVADIFLEVGKCLNYIVKTDKKQRIISFIVDILFACFAISFFVTRLVIFPRYLVYSLLVEAPRIMGMWNGYWIFAFLLIGLQCLHIFWFGLIVRMAIKLFAAGGGIEKDVRSDDDDVLGEEFQEEIVSSSPKKKN
jgi:ceramide synthetase